jgi:hypothetical protein
MGASHAQRKNLAQRVAENYTYVHYFCRFFAPPDFARIWDGTRVQPGRFALRDGLRMPPDPADEAALPASIGSQGMHQWDQSGQPGRVG